MVENKQFVAFRTSKKDIFGYIEFNAEVKPERAEKYNPKGFLVVML